MGIEKVENYIEKLMQTIDSEGILKTIITTSPEIGAIFQGVMSFYENKTTQKRLVDTVRLLNDEINMLDKNKIDFSFFQKEEFHDLFRNFIDLCLKTMHRQKILLNVQIFVGSIVIDNQQLRHSAEDLLGVVSELNPTDILVAKEIYLQQSNKPEEFDPTTPNEKNPENSELKFVRESGWRELQTKCNLEQVEFQLSLLKLVKAGLIKEIIGNYASYRGHWYIITPIFQRLAKLIKYAKEPIFYFGIHK